MILLGMPTYSYSTSMSLELKGIIFLVVLIYAFWIRSFALRFMRYRSALENEQFEKAEEYKFSMLKQGSTIVIMTIALVVGYFLF